MTDEEREELVIHLRQMSRSVDFYSPDALRRAADEIERLAKENAQLKDIMHRMNCDLMDAQSDVEPVEWRSTPAMRTRIRELARPDSDEYDRAVIAVLDDFDDAAKIAREWLGDPGIDPSDYLQILQEHIRASAANKSGK